MLSEIKLKSLSLKNRVVRSATYTQTCQIDNGIPTDRFYQVCESVAKGQPGMFIQEHAFVSERGRASKYQLGIHNDGLISFHKKANTLMKKASPDTVLCCQLAHAGNRSVSNQLNINSASNMDLVQVVQEFKAAALRAQSAHYDCVQIHAAHAYFLSQSLSSYYNQRTDEYNASDFKLLQEVFNAVKSAVDLPIGVKINCDDYIADHTMNPEQLVKVLKQIHFDFVEISGGGPPGFASRFTWSRYGQEVYYYKSAIELLCRENLINHNFIICTGGFETLEHGEQALKDGCSAVGFSRKFIRNPLFIHLDNKPCSRCNQCRKVMQDLGYLDCIHNIPQECQSQQ